MTKEEAEEVLDELFHATIMDMTVILTNDDQGQQLPSEDEPPPALDEQHCTMQGTVHCSNNDIQRIK